MKRKTKYILIIVIALVAIPLGFNALKTALTPAVGMLEIQGPIDDSIDYLDIIRQFEEDSQVRAVIIRLDSPGGKVGPSQEIYEAVLRLKKKKPVIASMGSVGASGAYYIACAADRIYALPGTLTGSIGVILEFFDVTEGLQKLGVSSRSITGGELKDAGSPFKHMSDKERQYFEYLARDVHEQFKDAVSKSRKIERSKVEEYADGRVFTGRQALANGLIDRLGGIDSAIEDAGKRAGIEGKPRIIKGEPGEGVWKEIEHFMESYTPISFGKGSAHLSRGFLRLEYSIQ
jgi:protease IV